MKNKICLISHESIYFNGNDFFCDNIDMKSIPEGLSVRNEIKLIGRSSKNKRGKIINISNIKIFKNLFSYLAEVFQSGLKKDYKYLVISLTPYTFLSILLLKILGKKVFLYLRSDGFKEYYIILGTLGKLIYGFMFKISSNLTSLISCRDHLLKSKKGIIVNPSQINQNWFQNLKEVTNDEIKLLYVGRMRKEKGIFSLIDLLQNKSDIKLQIINSENYKNNYINKNINIVELNNNKDEIIKYYDDCNIFILPSFTEAHPQVLDEALARLRPVVVFNEIEHVNRDREGVFVSNRSFTDLKNTCKFILENYQDIQYKMKKNILPTKKKFLNELESALNN
tara:strand:+ start:301 stop:1314 length:1014 start_codon:yes stop_codon:yes gene_type:complete